MPIVYKLIHPIEKRIYYVGYTEKSLNERLLGHIATSTHKTTLELVSQGLSPEIQSIEEGEHVTKDTEMYWIKRLAQEKVYLENRDGIINYQDKGYIFKIPEKLLNSIEMPIEDRYKCAIGIVLDELPMNPTVPIIQRIKVILEWALQ